MEGLLKLWRKRSPGFAKGLDMQPRQIDTYSDPLDLLWRFAPTPYVSAFHVGDFHVRVESNDPAILALLSQTQCREPVLNDCTFLWRIISDSAVAGGAESATILADGDVTFVNMGPAFLVAVDRQRKELLGFVGTGVSNSEFEEMIVPLLVRLTLHDSNDAISARDVAVELALIQGQGNE
jgi:hypothetical protein